MRIRSESDRTPDPYPPETPDQAHRFLREEPSIRAIMMVVDDRLAVSPDPDNDRVLSILRSGMTPQF